MKCGFSGGLVVDFPNSKKAKKYFLCLFAGEGGDYNPLPLVDEALLKEEEEEDDEAPQTVMFTQGVHNGEGQKKRRSKSC